MTDGQVLVEEPANREGPEFYLELGRRLWRQQRHSEAADSFARALELDPASATAHNNLGWALETAGDESGALGHYERAVELDPDLSLARVNLAKLLAKAGRHHDAEQVWCALAAVAPSDPTALGNVVHSALRAGDLETASASAQRLALIHHGPQEDGNARGRLHNGMLTRMTIPKLRHDIEQLAYLQSQGVMLAEAPALIEANLDPASGGMTIYDVEAPLSWDFDAYNRQGSKIGAFLREHSAQPMAVPYRSNRAVIFNSDLFHTTQPLRFRDGYQDRRINVTLLYGTREKDPRQARTKSHT